MLGVWIRGAEFFRDGTVPPGYWPHSYSFPGHCVASGLLDIEFVKGIQFFKVTYVHKVWVWEIEILTATRVLSGVYSNTKSLAVCRITSVLCAINLLYSEIRFSATCKNLLYCMFWKLYFSVYYEHIPCRNWKSVRLQSFWVLSQLSSSKNKIFSTYLKNVVLQVLISSTCMWIRSITPICNES